MSFSSDVLSIERNGAVGTLWLDRPDKRNAMSPALWKGLPEALAALTEDGEVRAIVLAGKGKIISAGHVAELAYTGKDIDAARAEKIGLVNDVYDDFDATYGAAFTMAMEIAANAPLAVRGTKFVLQQSEDLTTDQSLLLNGIWTMITTHNSNDLKEAMGAFMEKRAPEFRGN